MLKHLKNESNTTYTENGAVTNETTFSDCLDLFASIGALRHEDENNICLLFGRAYAENPDLAMKILFYARDVRGGLGERRVFRTVLGWLADNKPDSLTRSIPYIAEFGRWDDLLAIIGTPCEKTACSCLAKQFAADVRAMESGGTVSLLGKWLPSVNASNAETVRMAKFLAKNVFHLSFADYRKTLSRLRARIQIIENNLRERDYSFDYSAQPSKAMFKYRKAFIRNDGVRYSAFLNDVRNGAVSLHTGTLMPYELVDPYLRRLGGTCLNDLSREERLALNTTWDALTDFASDENALAVVDTSGSMYRMCSPSPAAVALSLGLYFAERSKGAFANHFIEFSSAPRLIEIKGKTFTDRLDYISSFSKIANTDLEAVFDLILSAAVKNNVPQSELPAKLYIISDMEFDACVYNADMTNFNNARKMFAEHGYELPQIVFWNVSSRNRQQPVTVNDRGVALVSGCSPRLFSMVMGGDLDPVSYMLSVVDTERYAVIAA